MKIYLKENVYDAALNRIRFLFDEFPNIVVGFSGGKDSTVTLNLALKVAEEKGRLPLQVLFLDQEAEWQSVIDYMRTVMYDPRVKPMWFQMPLKLFNATSTTDSWLQCWEPGKEWMREKEPIAIEENHYGTDRFAELFTKIFEVDFAGQKSCYLSGVRAEESPTRSMALTYHPTYKHITYGKILSKEQQHFTFYPLYDWSYTDIWKAIFDNKWAYCAIYDYMYMHGIPLNNMRVSNVHHETAITQLFFLQEIEGATWNKLTKRISGINTAGQLKEDFYGIKDLPYMFTSWGEYRDYLLENIITDPAHKETFRKKFVQLDTIFIHEEINTVMNKVCCTAILCNDYHMTKIGNFERRPDHNTYKKWRKGKVTYFMTGNKFIPKNELQGISAASSK